MGGGRPGGWSWDASWTLGWAGGEGSQGSTSRALFPRRAAARRAITVARDGSSMLQACSCPHGLPIGNLISLPASTPPVSVPTLEWRRTLALQHPRLRLRHRPSHPPSLFFCLPPRARRDVPPGGHHPRSRERGRPRGHILSFVRRPSGGHRERKRSDTHRVLAASSPSSSAPPSSSPDARGVRRAAGCRGRGCGEAVVVAGRGGGGDSDWRVRQLVEVMEVMDR